MTEIFPSPEYIAYLKDAADDEAARQRAIVQARNYDAGRHPVYLTDRMKEFIGLNATETDHPFKLNLVRLIIKAVVERLKVTGFDSDEAELTRLDGTTVKPLTAWAWDLWQAERMDARAMDVHRMAIRDGEAFVLVVPDPTEKRACFYPHQAYTAPEVGGDGYGVKVFYDDDDAENGTIAYAVKYWTEKRMVGVGKAVRRVNIKRMTMYWPDRIERYVWEKGDWAPYTFDGKPVQPWIGVDGMPLGVPVIPFRNMDCRDEAADAIGLNDAANKALVDLVAAADLNAFPLLVMLGFYPTKDGQPPAEDSSNMLATGPGAIIGTMKKPSDADAKFLPGADLQNLMDYVGSLVQWMAMTTDTPLSRFLATKQIAAEGTLKQQEGPLVSKVEARQVVFGDAWEDCLIMAAKIENTYFAAGLPLEEDVTLQTLWGSAATRDELAELQAAQIKAQALGVPQRKLWAEAGYSEWEIDQMQVMKDEQDQSAMARQQAVMAARAPVTRTVQRDGDGRIAAVVEQ